jgi:hypothetical protein
MIETNSDPNGSIIFGKMCVTITNALAYFSKSIVSDIFVALGFLVPPIFQVRIDFCLP